MRRHLRRAFLWYVAIVFAVAGGVCLANGISTVAHGYDPALGPHPVQTTATVDDYDVGGCTRSGCSYDEKVTFAAEGSTRTVTITNVSSRPDIGATQTVWYPAGHPEAAQTDGPSSAADYWGGAAVGLMISGLIFFFALRRHRRSPTPPAPAAGGGGGPAYGTA